MVCGTVYKEGDIIPNVVQAEQEESRLIVIIVEKLLAPKSFIGYGLSKRI